MFEKLTLIDLKYFFMFLLCIIAIVYFAVKVNELLNKSFKSIENKIDNINKKMVKRK